MLDVTPLKEITWGCIWRRRLKPRQSFSITLYIQGGPKVGTRYIVYKLL